MLSHEKSTDLLDKTMSALEGEPASAEPQNGPGLIGQWLTSLQEAENTKEVVSALEQLKTQLQNGSPDPKALSATLKTLADKTQILSTEVGPEGDLFTRLEGLSTALQQFSDKLLNQDTNS